MLLRNYKIEFIVYNIVASGSKDIIIRKLDFEASNLSF